MFILRGPMGQKGRLIQNADRCGIKKSVFHPCRSVAIFLVAAPSRAGSRCLFFTDRWEPDLPSESAAAPSQSRLASFAKNSNSLSNPRPSPHSAQTTFVDADDSRRRSLTGGW